MINVSMSGGFCGKILKAVQCFVPYPGPQGEREFSAFLKYQVITGFQESSVRTRSASIRQGVRGAAA